MSASNSSSPRTLSAPVVLALASGMIAIGAVAYLARRPTVSPGSRVSDGGAQRVRAELDDSTEIAAAETYLDGWRKRDHDTAMRVSVGAAHGEALARKQAEERLPTAERVATERIWNQLAGDRLHFVVSKRRVIDESHAYLEGRAEGRFLDRPYVRQVAFEIVSEGEGTTFRVNRMDLGPELESTHDAVDGGAGRVGDAAP